MVTPKINENCHYVQNDPHRCNIKAEKIHFDILCCYGVIKESLPGGRIPPPPPPPGEIGLNFRNMTTINASCELKLTCFSLQM